MALKQAGKTGGVAADATGDGAAKQAGATAGQCTVVPLGSDWARVQTTTGKDEPKNRRVQIWVRK